MKFTPLRMLMARIYTIRMPVARDARGNSALENKMTFSSLPIPRRAHRTLPVQSRSTGRHGSIHVYSGDDCACDFIDDEPTRRGATLRVGDLAVDTRDCD